MGAKELGAVLEEYRREHDLTLAELSDEIGRVPPLDKPLSETGIRRMLLGQRRLGTEWVGHVIGQLEPRGLNADKAWRAAYPEVAEALAKTPFQESAVASTASSQGTLMNPLAPWLVAVPRRAERRRWPRHGPDRRRGARLSPLAPRHVPLRRAA